MPSIFVVWGAIYEFLIPFGRIAAEAVSEEEMVLLDDATSRAVDAIESLKNGESLLSVIQRANTY